MCPAGFPLVTSAATGKEPAIGHVPDWKHAWSRAISPRPVFAIALVSVISMKKLMKIGIDPVFLETS
jgi:hypothetical protein